MKDHKNMHFWPDLAEALAAKHLGSLRFDFSGNGESEGEFKYGNIVQEVRYIRFTPSIAAHSLGARCLDSCTSKMMKRHHGCKERPSVSSCAVAALKIGTGPKWICLVPALLGLRPMPHVVAQY